MPAGIQVGRANDDSFAPNASCMLGLNAASIPIRSMPTQRKSVTAYPPITKRQRRATSEVTVPARLRVEVRARSAQLKRQANAGRAMIPLVLLLFSSAGEHCFNPKICNGWTKLSVQY